MRVALLGKRFTALTLAIAILISSFGISGALLVQEARAASCNNPPVFFGRACFHGYFKNNYELIGRDVRTGGIPASVNTVNEFINLVLGDLNSGNAQRVTGAQFVILTMIGRAAGMPKSVSAAQITDWQNRLRTYSNISENGTTSVGSNGRIDWNVWTHFNCGTPNTIYQDSQNDVAPYVMSATNSDCDKPSVLDNHIYIRNNAGTPIYIIRRACMNPMGVINGLPTTPPPNFNLTPSVNITVNGAAGTAAEVGDTVQFTFVVNNSGSTASTSVACNTYATTYPGYHASGGAPPGGSPAGPNPGCPRVFPVGSTTVATQSVPITTTNQTICRALTVNPATFNGGARSSNERCVIVASKPYLKVYGGDISVGGGVESAPDTCTTNANGAVSAWNKRSATYAGAGAQYAAFAMATISDFATAQGNTSGAPVPRDLAFANNAANPANGNFGGNFGSVNCIPDYYGRRPATTLAYPGNISAMGTGTYGINGNATLAGGNIAHSEKITLYVDGNVYITGNITYPGNWNQSQTPLFQLVVRGNIYVGSGVNRLDGVYIAQRNGGAGGTIYTCATAMAAPTLTNGAFFNACNNKLTINGAFVANSVEFLRTSGTLSQSAAGEQSGASPAGEVFNFNPSLWMAQPVDGTGRVDNYDAITSLPPVL